MKSPLFLSDLLTGHELPDKDGSLSPALPFGRGEGESPPARWGIKVHRGRGFIEGLNGPLGD
jgi:hypothetical protein